MRRLARILLNAATAASLVLLVGAAALWARSGKGDRVCWLRFEPERPRASQVEVLSVAGEVRLHLLSLRPEASDIQWARENGLIQLAHDRQPGKQFLPESRFGFAYQFYRWDRGWERGWGWQAGVPYWLVLGLLSLAFLSLLRLQRARRSCPGQPLCPCCGYDLRATPARCPECGTPTSATPPPPPPPVA